MIKLTKEFLEQEWKLGKTQKEIAEEIGVRPGSITYYAKKFNIVFLWGGQRKRADLTNKKFGRFTVKCLVKKKDHKKNTTSAVWECKCECGKTKNVISRDLLSGVSTSCGCYRLERLRTGYEGISGTVWSSIICSINNRKIPINITIKDVWEMFLYQDKKCKLSGKDISFTITHSHSHDQTASIDRIDSSKGYDKKNIQIVHKDVNLMKNIFDNAEFIDLCKRIYFFNPKDVKRISDSHSYISGKVFKGYKDISGTYWYGNIRMAKKRGIDFNIKIEDVWNLYLKQGGLCAISGIKIEFMPAFDLKLSKQTASLDRIDSSKGYSLDNIQIVHKYINRMKNDFSNEYFIQTLKDIGKYQIELDKENFCDTLNV